MRIVGQRTGSNPTDTNRFVVCNSLMLLARCALGGTAYGVDHSRNLNTLRFGSVGNYLKAWENI